MFVGLGIVEVLTVDQAMAVAYEPYFASQTAVNDDRSAETLLGMVVELLEYLPALVAAQAAEQGKVALANDARGSEAELVARDVLGHTSDIATDELHGVASIAHRAVMASLGLRGGAVDDGYEVSGDDDSVLAFLRGVLRDDALLYYFHF